MSTLAANEGAKMLDATLVELIARNGIAVVLSAVVVVLFTMVIKHILKQQEKIMDSAMAMNATWQKVIDEHTQKIREYSNSMSEAARYQREEHIKLMQLADDTCSKMKDLNVTVANFQESCEDCKRVHEKILEEMDEIDGKK